MQPKDEKSDREQCFLKSLLHLSVEKDTEVTELWFPFIILDSRSLESRQKNSKNKHFTVLSFFFIFFYLAKTYFAYSRGAMTCNYLEVVLRIFVPGSGKIAESF